ncbi:MAG: MurR/RpiR family transcriptional regulator [Deltaproteobacteria bacterium]|jgi:DNA-binding MurR/RpiR family transcriptional regulator|nr:MurR/RpiR family transcriptional regulator [Deltaproteobacteria bacterium]
MVEKQKNPLKSLVDKRWDQLTPKSRALAEYIINYTRRAAMLTIKELAANCKVSDATVVRFVTQLGFGGYIEFQQMVRDCANTEMSLLDRMEMSHMASPGAQKMRQLVSNEMDNLKALYDSMNYQDVEKCLSMINQASKIYVIGSRHSYTFSYHMGWSLKNILNNVSILNGSDSTTIDWLTTGQTKNSLVIIVATTRYPNELIKIGKLARLQGFQLLAITDSNASPIIEFAHLSLVAPSQHIPFIGGLSAIGCLISFIIQELARVNKEDVKNQQNSLERVYLENDIFFNLRL